LLSNLYLNEVDKMLERAREVTRNGKYTNVEYASILAELASLRDDVDVLTAIVQRLDNNSTRLLAEIRATSSQVSHHGERLRRLESLSAPDSEPSV
jgi:RNA-directed DNA polymerase